MANNSENKVANRNTDRSAQKIDSGIRQNSLVAFLGAIKFRKPQRNAHGVDRYFAQPQPQARQRRPLAEENFWIRSAN